MVKDSANGEIRVADIKISREEACDLKEKCPVTIWSERQQDAKKSRIAYYSIDMSELAEGDRVALQSWIEKTIMSDENAYGGKGCLDREWQGNSLIYRFDNWEDYVYFGLEMAPNHPAMGNPRVHYPEERELGRAWRIADSPALTFNSAPERATLPWIEREASDKGPTRPTTRSA